MHAHVIGTGIDALYDLAPSGILKCKFITYTDVPCCVNSSGQVFVCDVCALVLM